MAFCTDKYEVKHMGTSPALPNHFMYEVRTATSLCAGMRFGGYDS